MRKPLPVWSAAAAVLFVAAIAWLSFPTGRRSPVGVATQPVTSPAPAAQPPAPTDGDYSVFLPVESSTWLVGLQPVPASNIPDEVAQPFWRAVLVDDLTAVGANADAALHFRSAREVYIPVLSPVY